MSVRDVADVSIGCFEYDVNLDRLDVQPPVRRTTTETPTSAHSVCVRACVCSSYLSRWAVWPLQMSVRQSASGRLGANSSPTRRTRPSALSRHSPPTHTEIERGRERESERERHSHRFVGVCVCVCVLGLQASDVGRTYGEGLVSGARQCTRMTGVCVCLCWWGRGGLVRVMNATCVIVGYCCVCVCVVAGDEYLEASEALVSCAHTEERHGLGHTRAG